MAINYKWLREIIRDLRIINIANKSQVLGIMGDPCKAGDMLVMRSDGKFYVANDNKEALPESSNL